MLLKITKHSILFIKNKKKKNISPQKKRNNNKTIYELVIPKKIVIIY